LRSFSSFTILISHFPHPVAAAAGIVDAALVGGEHFNEEANDTGGGIELAAVLALGAGELGEEVFEDAAEEVFGAAGHIDELDGADEVDQFAEAVFVEVGAAVVLVEGAFEAGVVTLEGDHGVVDLFADGREFGAGLELLPSGFLGHPKDAGSQILVFVFGIGAFKFAKACDELRLMFLEGVGDVFEEDEAEDDVLVFRRVHVVAELVGGEPELGLEA
jgi:hypothetical protein